MAKIFQTGDQTTQIQNDGDNNKKTRVYNPYQGIDAAAARLQPLRTLYDLPTSPEFLFQEEAMRKRPSWSENLTFGTGLAYLVGAGGGWANGTYSGLMAAEAGESLKLRINRVLNSGGAAGRKFGNRLGIMGMMFAGLESGIYSLRGEDDALNYVAAGLATGAIYRAAAGPRSAAVAGILGGLIGGATLAAKNVLRRYAAVR